MYGFEMIKYNRLVMIHYKHSEFQRFSEAGGDSNSLTIKDKGSIILLQSYCSPSPMSNDFGVY